MSTLKLAMTFPFRPRCVRLGEGRRESEAATSVRSKWGARGRPSALAFIISNRSSCSAPIVWLAGADEDELAAGQSSSGPLSGSRSGSATGRLNDPLCALSGQQVAGELDSRPPRLQTSSCVDSETNSRRPLGWPLVCRGGRPAVGPPTSAGHLEPPAESIGLLARPSTAHLSQLQAQLQLVVGAAEMIHSICAPFRLSKLGGPPEGPKRAPTGQLLAKSLGVGLATATSRSEDTCCSLWPACRLAGAKLGTIEWEGSTGEQTRARPATRWSGRKWALGGRESAARGGQLGGSPRRWQQVSLGLLLPINGRPEQQVAAKGRARNVR